MRRRLLIGKALVHQPRVLFLDEPTAGVDVELRQSLWQYVRTLRDRGTTIVLTTHYLEEAEELADRVGIIDRGRLLLLEEKEALLRRYAGKRLRVVLASPLEVLPQALRDQGARLEENGRVVLVTAEPGASLAPTLAALASARLAIEDVETHRMTLEDVFVSLLQHERNDRNDRARAAAGEGT